jgi:hypothetical protein
MDDRRRSLDTLDVRTVSGDDEVYPRHTKLLESG